MVNSQKYSFLTASKSKGGWSAERDRKQPREKDDLLSNKGYFLFRHYNHTSVAKAILQAGLSTTR